ncbi:two-component sensor histidine kinase [Actinoplanes sp. ATCC 53533]|uniref:sensor histidine kinase n=1 Tax=Actinoplanes sp. ATCC 53533 TaxID=1288362 RepID=UPI000F76887F|nr:histidine kinase [Actinoplanes sp. ATCC 53533]RSM62229.1 two-component sensor histidine kinase [Actinoplanes sp. ATCC 53533]
MEISQTENTTTARTRRRGGLAIGGIIALGLAATIDLLVVATNGDRVWVTLLVLAVGLTALLWPAGARPPWLTPPVRTIVPALGSAAYTIGVLLGGTPTAIGPGEPLILICLLVVAVRNCRPGTAAVAAFVIGASIVVTPLRVSVGSPGEAGVSYAVSAVLAVLASGGAALGGYLRSLDRRREAAIARTRRTERLSMAADLHDFVAHHVTGILVQTQMARALAAGGEPDRLDPVLERIEHAAGEALGAMRRTVGILRSSDADHPAAGDLAAVPDLVSGFTAAHRIHATLHRDPGVPDTLPPEVQAAAYRVIQEALTNVGRHATDATETTIDLRCDDGHLEVTVHNDGTSRTRPASGRSDHYGLIGLTERVSALGGHLHAGPEPTGGWRVAARLPTSDSLHR